MTNLTSRPLQLHGRGRRTLGSDDPALIRYLRSAQSDPD